MPRYPPHLDFEKMLKGMEMISKCPNIPPWRDGKCFFPSCFVQRRFVTSAIFDFNDFPSVGLSLSSGPICQDHDYRGHSRASCRTLSSLMADSYWWNYLRGWNYLLNPTKSVLTYLYTI